MFTKKTNFYTFVFLILFSCNSVEKDKNQSVLKNTFFDDKEFVINNEYNVGDVRRYGVFPDKNVDSNQLNKIIDLAEKGLKIKFPKGFYKTSFILKKRKKTYFNFNDACFSGQIYIIDSCENITFKGKITTYNKFFTQESNKIKIDTLIIASDTLKNTFKKRSLGCNIYAGTKDLSIKKLLIKDLGSGDDYYKYSLAALQIYGWNNNPENINLEHVVIEKSDRHGAYITGKNHSIKYIEINKVGLGSIKHHNGLEDADIDEVENFSSIWINKCSDSNFEQIVIDMNNSKSNYSINFDEGIASEPSIINYLTIKNNKNNIPTNANDLTNILVRHINKTNE